MASIIRPPIASVVTVIALCMLFEDTKRAGLVGSQKHGNRRAPYDYSYRLPQARKYNAGMLMIVTEFAAMTEATPAIAWVFEALCFYDSIGSLCRQAGIAEISGKNHFASYHSPRLPCGTSGAASVPGWTATPSSMMMLHSSPRETRVAMACRWCSSR